MSLPDLPALFVLASASVIFMLGALHLALTFRGQRLYPRDATLFALMHADSPRLTRGTTMWKAWVGFNASHSVGALMFGLIYGYLAAAQPNVLFRSEFLLLLGAALLMAYQVLALRYWFSKPRMGIALALVLYVVGLGLHVGS